MVILTLITQIFILIQNSLVASHFGVSEELDAFYLTRNISNFIYGFIGAGISTIIVPYLKDKSNKKGLDIFITIMYTFGFLLLLLTVIFRNQIIVFVSGNNDYTFLAVASKIFIYTILTGYFNSLIQLVKSVLEFKGKFNRQKVIILFTTIVIVMFLWIGNNASIYDYAIMILIMNGVALFFHILLIRKKKFKFNISFNIKNTSFREMIKLYIPTALSTGTYQITLLIDTSIASRLNVGDVSILNYSNSIISMLNILLLGNLISFIYPKLVKKTNEKDRLISLESYIIFINLIMCLTVTLFYVIGKEGISFLFERGKFTSANTNIVYLCGLILVISLPINGVRDLYYRYFYINKDTRTPFLNSIMVSVINILLSIILSVYLGLLGVVIGTTVASMISLFLIIKKFKNKFQINYNQMKLKMETLKFLVATFITILVTMFVKNIIVVNNNLLNMIIFSIIALILYTILLVIFKSKILNINL